ncbi:MAG: NAD-dependent epimerase/dehydratase family protein [Bacteroidales bacterium]
MKSVLFSGASGFLGANILPVLKNKYSVKTIGISVSDDTFADLSNNIPNLPSQYDIVLHAAGKAHVVPKTEAEKQAFYDVNYQGTVNLCKALERSGVPESFIFISTVAVYGCEDGIMIDESHPLNGTTPYAKSKIMAEQYLTEWCSKHNVTLGIIRPSLIAGKNAPGNLGAMVKGIEGGRYLSIAGGKAQKSVLMVEDVARLIPLLSEKGGVYNVCDSYNPSFKELEDLISKQLLKSKPISIPYWIAKSVSLIGDLLGSKAPINSSKLDKITKSLTFSNNKATLELGWKPLSVLENYKIK